MSSRPLPPPAAPSTRRRRWGLRTMACLALAIFALAVAEIQGYHTPGTLVCALLGIVAGAYCSVHGVRDLLSLEWYRQRLTSGPPPGDEPREG